MTAALTQPPVELVFKALSDLTRLRILNLLRGGELCVCDIVDVLDVPQPLASRHLAYLRRAKLVLARKDGLWIYYRLTPARRGFHQAVAGCLAACAGEVPQLTDDAQRLAASKRRGRCCT